MLFLFLLLLLILLLLSYLLVSVFVIFVLCGCSQVFEVLKSKYMVMTTMVMLIVIDGDDNVGMLIGGDDEVADGNDDKG